MLLLQSSDWQFIISTGEVEDYAIRRFNGHAEDCRNLLGAVEQVLNGGDLSSAVQLTRELQARDDVFREIIPSIREAISDGRPATKVASELLAADR
jgi:1,4-alpha-glucan branching enzyme